MTLKENVVHAGRVSYAAIAWLIGLPLPIVIIALLIGGCNRW